MQLVVFAVVLILTALLNAGALSGTQYISNCDGYISQAGELVCGTLHSNYLNYDPKRCTLVCTNGERPKLPDVCSGGKVNCTSEVEKKIEDWVLRIQEQYR
uniref:Putative secreted protein n=1 Tax=Ixodes ricinus TaxID=34613 RepID=V5HK09_IXORI